MRAALHIIEGQKKGMVIALAEQKQRTIVGRDRRCDIQIDDSGVSRRHFCIVEQEGKFFLQDMGSSNGTFINGKQTLWQEIHMGDKIACGGTQLQFSFEAESPPFSEVQETAVGIESMTQPLRKISRAMLIQQPPHETGKIGFTKYSPEVELPKIEEHNLDIICRKDRQEPTFTEAQDINKLSQTVATLYKVVELLNSQMGLEELLDVLLKAALEITKAERGCLILKKSDNGELERAAFHTIHPGPAAVVPISRTVVKLAIEQGIATVSSDALSDKNLCQDSSSIIVNNIRSVMCVPLEGKDRTLGAIYVDNLFARNFFDDEDLELLRAIGRQAGMAVARALLQEKISKSEQKYRTIFEKAPFCIGLVSPSGRVLDINPAGCESLELQDGDKSSILDIFPNATLQFQRLLQHAEPFETKEFHTENIQGKNMIFHLKGVPLLDQKGKMEGGMIIAEDITEAKRLQSQIIHQDKMATIGLLGAGVAHEFNNIIAGMLGYAQLTLKRQGDKQGEGLAKVVIEQCQRARDVVERLLNFSRRADTPKISVKLDELLEDVFQLASRELVKNNIQVVRQYQDKPSIMGHSGQIQQVFLNLVINAAQAMERGGTLTVSLKIHNGWVRITFQDTGIGIPRKYLSCIFEPFFTTKGNHGTGLGLAVSYNIVREYGGEITVESKENQGSIFTIHLPA